MTILPLDLWQFSIIDYLEYDDQSKLIQCIENLELTDLIGMEDVTDDILKKMRYVTRLDTFRTNVTNNGIRHLSLSVLYCNYHITDRGFEHMKDVNIKTHYFRMPVNTLPVYSMDCDGDEMNVFNMDFDSDEMNVLSSIHDGTFKRHMNIISLD
jgi:hypothetical protein